MYMLIHIYINKYICTYLIDYHLGACQVHDTQSCPTLVILWTVASQAPLSMEFSRQEYWSGFPFPTLVYTHTHTDTHTYIYTHTCTRLYIDYVTESVE